MRMGLEGEKIKNQRKRRWQDFMLIQSVYNHIFRFCLEKLSWLSPHFATEETSNCNKSWIRGLISGSHWLCAGDVKRGEYIRHHYQWGIHAIYLAPLIPERCYTGHCQLAVQHQQFVGKKTILLNSISIRNLEIPLPPDQISVAGHIHHICMFRVMDVTLTKSISINLCHG